MSAFEMVEQAVNNKIGKFTKCDIMEMCPEIFGDAVLANAILDRQLHHSKVFTINGPSYRTKDYLINNDCTS